MAAKAPNCAYRLSNPAAVTVLYIGSFTAWGFMGEFSAPRLTVIDVEELIAVQITSSGDVSDDGPTVKRNCSVPPVPI
jgi:hypothetical protein